MGCPDSAGLKPAARNPYARQQGRHVSDEMILQFLPMVHKIVQRAVTYLRPPLSRDDLISAGTVGLLKAARDYDPSLEVKFQTYAYIRIRGAVLDELKKNSFVPDTVKKQIRDAAKLRIELTERRGTVPSDEELAHKMQMSVEKLDQLYSSARANQFLSFDGFSEEDSLADCFVAEDTPEPSNPMEKAELVEALTQAISQLEQRQRQIIVLYYQQDLTMKQIAEVLNLTEPRVSQLHAKAVFSLSVKMNRWKNDNE